MKYKKLATENHSSGAGFSVSAVLYLLRAAIICINLIIHFIFE